VDEDALPSLELAPLLLDEELEGLAEELEGLDEELSLGELLVLPLLGEGEAESELVLPVLGELAEPELMLPLLGGEPASAPDEELPVPLAPDAPEELSPELEPELLAPALAPPLAAPLAPPPCAQAAVAKATMAAV